MKKPKTQTAKAARSVKLERATLGFRAHSGWAALIALAKSARAIQLLGRARFELARPEIPRPVQPYHAAQKMELKEAEAYIGRFAKEAQSFATQSMQIAIEGLRMKGYQVVGCGIVAGSGRPAPTVKEALASHPLLHTAEGELFRNAIIQACRRCHLPVLEVKERELFERGVKELGLAPEGLQFILDKIGNPFGPPWGQDQKLATLAAWLALTDPAKSWLAE